MENQIDAKEKYFNEMNKFLKIMNLDGTITAEDLDKKVEICLSILSRHNIEGKEEIYVKASNKKFKLACKFISYYYQLETRQELKKDLCKFTCCQYKANNYKLSGVLQKERPKFCTCGKLTTPKEDKVSVLSTGQFIYYGFTIDSIFFYYKI